MKRNIDIKEISDGKLYGPNDMVKADCRGCEGCSACCHGMGTSIVLTPLDIYRLEKELNASFGELMTKGSGTESGGRCDPAEPGHAW